MNPLRSDPVPRVFDRPNFATTRSVLPEAKQGKATSSFIAKRKTAIFARPVAKPSPLPKAHLSTGFTFYRLHKPVELMRVVVTLLVHGCPPKAIEAAPFQESSTYELDERTVASWQDKAGAHAQKLHEHLVQNQKVELGQVQADELSGFLGL